MSKRKIFVGEQAIHTKRAPIRGQFVDIDGEAYYQIQNYHEMPDFFMSIVSDSDHWMFISSNGSLSAGRKNRDNAIFPYYTVDKIHDYNHITGSKTCFLVEKNEKAYRWEPFSDESQYFYSITRNLYKSNSGNNIIFEEINSDLGLRFRYGWYNSEKFGFVKKSTVFNTNKTPVKFKVIDGIQNILPYGVDYNFQNEYSNLLDAYKKNEKVEGSTLALFMLSSIPVDKAEPSEALKATTVWSVGFGSKSKILISSNQVNKFKKGWALDPEYDIKATRGAYFINAEFEINKDGNKEWFTIAEASQGSADVSNLNSFIQSQDHVEQLIVEDIKQGTLNLKKMVSCADGFQKTNTQLCCARHFSNTLYNIMRGGIFANNPGIDKNDYAGYLWQINKLLSKEYHAWLEKLPKDLTYTGLISRAENTGNADLLRITYEYLPLSFSRRHGDPSRPWNIFSIETRNEDGGIKYYYEGNWRDIFQNWEALSLSYPAYIEGILCKFVNASTIDGYNPYRIMRDGIDWESPDPNDPWSYIGYWGDHQIIYLQKLLELSDKFHPGHLDQFMISEIFSYANVPYQIKPYDDIIKNPKDTVIYNTELNNQIKAEAMHLGADANLLKNKSGDQIYKVNLTEKILATLLSKMSNFIPEAGIWMNTQRPEWNDANNALVGNGCSMVTLYYLRRFLNFWFNNFNSLEVKSIKISEEVAALFENIFSFLTDHQFLIEKGFDDSDRRKFADHLGRAHGKYRNEIYNFSFSGEKREIKLDDLLEFTRISLNYIDQSIAVNKRKDGLYHAYNLISIHDDKISIRHLYEMLEGQVAILSSGFLSTMESLEVLNALKNSKIYRPDQYSYMLYPNRQLPRFMEKNVIPKNRAMGSSLFKRLLEDKETSVIREDNQGAYHFNGSFRNAQDLEAVLNKLRVGSYSHLVEQEKEKILEIYEEVFDHQSFTGRSGTFYGYEGLGSIYWHMVSKLLLATQECYYKAFNEGADESILGKLKDHYYEIKAGIGLYKSPELYGAFPTDAYSHTPAGSGVKQPGLTGQVKEDIISRFGEMGVIVKQGKISFESTLLNKEEILENQQLFEFFSIKGEKRKISLTKNQLGFTFCQVPIIYTFSGEEKIKVVFENGNIKNISGHLLDTKLSRHIFNRSGKINLIEVNFNDNKNVS